MHEMAIIGNVVKVISREAELAGAKRVVSVTLRVGEIRDFHSEWVQRYFDFLAKDTIAEGATIETVTTPLMFRCGTCGNDYRYDLRSRHVLDEAGTPIDASAEGEKPRCPLHPDADVHIVSGNEIIIDNLEVA